MGFSYDLCFRHKVIEAKETSDALQNALSKPAGKKSETNSSTLHQTNAETTSKEPGTDPCKQQPALEPHHKIG